MTRRVTFWSLLSDLVSPRACVACGARLAESEEVVCAACNLHLPRTGFAATPRDNAMVRLFWGHIPVERAAALFYYQAQADASHAIYQLKYHDHPDYAHLLGRLAAKEAMPLAFFEGIDTIVPVPLAPTRQRERGYNQAMEMARGVAEATGLPILAKAVRRRTFGGSQTMQRDYRQRTENVEGAFELVRPDQVRGRHVLLVDDVVTTGATATACGKALCAAGDVTISVLSLGFTK